MTEAAEVASTAPSERQETTLELAMRKAREELTAKEEQDTPEEDVSAEAAKEVEEAPQDTASEPVNDAAEESAEEHREEPTEEA